MQQDAFRGLKIVHLAITAGLTVFAIVAFFLFKTGQLKVTDPSLDRTLQLVTVSASVLFFLVGFNLFKKKILAARNDSGDGEARFQLYKSACIAWWAMLEGPGLLAVISFMLTGNYAFLVLAGAHVLALLVFMPHKENIAVLLNLNSEEIDRLEGK